jgi:hypothetical protein
MPKTITVGAYGEVNTGVLEGHEGRVMGYDSIENEVTIMLDQNTHVTVPAEHVNQ